MSHLYLSLNEVKTTIDRVVENHLIAVFDTAELTSLLKEVSRMDSHATFHDLEAFATNCGFTLNYRDHNREVLLSKPATGCGALAR